MAPFQHVNLGILACTGHHSALAQLQLTLAEHAHVKATGSLRFGLWRSIHLVKQTSVCNQMLAFFDWVRCQLFGHDIASIDEKWHHLQDCTHGIIQISKCMTHLVKSRPLRL